MSSGPDTDPIPAAFFDEFAGSPQFSGSSSELTATRRGLIPGGISSVNLLYSALFPPGLPPSLLPGSIVLRADRIDVEPFGGDESHISDLFPVNAPPVYVATISYKTRPWETSENGGMWEWKRSIGGSILRISNTSMRWDGEDKTVSTPEVEAVVRVPIVTHELRLHRIVSNSVPWATFRSLIGKVNDAEFAGADEDMVLFEGVTEDRHVASDGSLESELSLAFSERVVASWQKAYDHSHAHGTWRTVKRPNGDSIFEQGDFSQLLPS
jgi:hypothetical protein